MAIAAPFYSAMTGAPRGPGPRRVGASPYISGPPLPMSSAAAARTSPHGRKPFGPSPPLPMTPALPPPDIGPGVFDQRVEEDYGPAPFRSPRYATPAPPPGFGPISRPYYR